MSDPVYLTEEARYTLASQACEAFWRACERLTKAVSDRAVSDRTLLTMIGQAALHAGAYEAVKEPNVHPLSMAHALAPLARIYGQCEECGNEP